MFGVEAAPENQTNEPPENLHLTPNVLRLVISLIRGKTQYSNVLKRLDLSHKKLEIQKANGSRKKRKEKTLQQS